jgi:hypothetical protein
MHPKDRVPAWPEQAAWMRLQCAIGVLQPFMSPEEYKSVRARICAWDVASEPITDPRAIARWGRA